MSAGAFPPSGPIAPRLEAPAAARVPIAAAQVPFAPPQVPDDALLRQAASQLNSGDIGGARTIYESMAQRANWRGAFALAETYDPSFIARRRISGLKPDPGLARAWYERAAKLGSLEASERLKNLRQGELAAPRSSASGVLRR